MRQTGWISRYTLLIGGMLAVAGCNTTSPMTIPERPDPLLHPVHGQQANRPTFALSKVIAGLRRGTVIAHFPAWGSKNASGSFCNDSHPRESILTWGGGTTMLGNWSSELGGIFHEVLTSKGLSIAGDPAQMFQVAQTVSSAEYLVGARITDIKGNLCEEHYWWDGVPMRKYSGEFYIKVEWVIFSNLLRREVLKISTHGHAVTRKPVTEGIVLTFHEAFAQATENMLSSRRFADLATRRIDPVVEAGFDGDTIELKGVPASRRSFASQMEPILKAVVTVSAGGGHGSGFFVSDDGLVMTNAHVVGTASRVRVTLSSGRKVYGEVVRRDPTRDVALVRVEPQPLRPLPLRFSRVRQAEKVYAIGTPTLEALSSTVTSGIVSAVRSPDSPSASFIQSDTPVSPGNSGGPLLDDRGNVVGIAVLKVRGESLNLFIPIGAALDAIRLKPAGGA
jgi:hypothetical protein